MSEPVRASDLPLLVDVEEGKVYMWCSCGKSNKQPFCDGSHAGTDFSPVIYKATESRKISFCGCKNTRKQPICDGSHYQK
jgi:CDGSH-type Zn-finger protein